MPTTSNFGWTTPADTDLVKDGAAAIRTLGNGIDNSLVDLKGGTTNQVLAKNSNTDLDFKWVADASGIPATIFDAKGDIIAATAADTADRLGVGTNGQVLTADSTTATGLKWATPSAGGLTLITSTTANAISSLDFNSISGSYKNLLLVWGGIYHSAANSDFQIRLNNNSGNVYSPYGIWHQSTTPNIVNTETSTTHIYGNSTRLAAFGYSADLSSTRCDTSVQGYLMVYDYASSTKFKRYDSAVSWYNNTNGVYENFVGGGVFRSTTAITSINVVRVNGTATFSNVTNTQILLYGVS